ncbi:MAG: hypothetical protein WD069_22585 [Planctomycetales bacterium]
MSHRVVGSLAVAIASAWSASSVHAGIGDPTVRTDHPQYAGEGAFQEVEDCVKFATQGVESTVESPQAKAIALYLWILNHQYHLMTPREWSIPGAVPDNGKEGGFDNLVYDANRARFSYGYALCGTVHAWNEVYWKALGMNARRRGFPGHTNSEIAYGGSWHAYDTDMAGLVFRKDGVVAGYDDIIRDKLLPENVDNLPCYPFAWPADFKGMTDGWKQIAAGGEWYTMYNSGYEGMPGIVHLRSGETFTRYFDRDHFGGPSKRRFWHNKAGGPARDWTFVNSDTPRHEGSQHNGRGNASYCNGEFVYEPDLTSPKYREGTAAQTDNVAIRSASPRLHSADGVTASVTFQHFSPYVIAGDPADDANPMSQPATDGLVVEGQAVGDVEIAVSNDQGQTWHDAGTLRGEFRKDLTEQTKGRYGWQVQFKLPRGAGLDAVKFTTTTQVSQSIYPRLKANGSQVTYRAANRAVVAVDPNFGLPQSALTNGEPPASAGGDLRAPSVVAGTSDNVQYFGRSPKSDQAFRTTNNKPGQVTFRVESPAPLKEVRAAFRYKVRVPPPENCDFHLDVSTDGGKTWQEFARADVAKDNDYSSGWAYGRADASAANAKSALVRATFYQDGYQTGLFDAEVYGIHETPAPQAAKLTYAWKEGGQVKTHVEAIPAGAKEKTFTVPTGAKIVDEYVRIEAP